MLTIVHDGPVFPWMTVKQINATLSRLPCHLVTGEGLMNLSSVSAPLARSDQPLCVTAYRFGGRSAQSDFHPAIRHFISNLKQRGIIPEYEQIDGQPGFAYWFDLSTKAGRAYYVIYTMRSGQEIVVVVFCSDPADVMPLVQLIDQALYSIIRLSEVPEISPAESSL